MSAAPQPGPARTTASGAGQAWMISLADLLALMLTFFVLLFSMNAVQYADWQPVVSSFRKQFNPRAAEVRSEPDQGIAVRGYVASATSLDYLAAIFRDKLAAPEWHGARLTRLADRIVLSLPSDLVFGSGRSEPGAQARALITALSEQLAQLGNRIEIAGHTDPAPIGSASPYASNWELSLHRAAAVAERFRASGYARPIRVVGYADSRFGDLSPALPRDERTRLARRVDIVIVADGEEVSDAP